MADFREAFAASALCYPEDIVEVLLASPRGFCAGVDRAIDIVELALKVYGPPVYVRKEIVHNRFVVEDLRQRGAVFIEEVADVPEGAVAVFSAHGIAPSVRADAGRRRLITIDATCPLVTKVHLEVIRFVQEGYDLLLVGHAGHDEVIGTMGEAPDRIKLVTCVEDADSVVVANPDKVMVLTQTTLSMDDTAAIMARLRARFPRLSLPPSDDICYATRNRQQAVKEMARQAPVILVVGAPNSSNSIRLREVAKDAGARAFLVNHVGEVDWSALEGIPAVGVTAGASAPESIVRELTNSILQRFGGRVREIVTVPETVRFMIPPELERPARARGVAVPSGVKG
jgi:4-hydroxy-3-methylbut-2-enyl diphosphate reductase